MWWSYLFYWWLVGFHQQFVIELLSFESWKMKGQTKNHHSKLCKALAEFVQSLWRAHYSSGICPPQMVGHFEGKNKTHSNGHLAFWNDLKLFFFSFFPCNIWWVPWYLYHFSNKLNYFSICQTFEILFIICVEILIKFKTQLSPSMTLKLFRYTRLLHNIDKTLYIILYNHYMSKISKLKN